MKPDEFKSLLDDLDLPEPVIDQLARVARTIRFVLNRSRTINGEPGFDSEPRRLRAALLLAMTNFSDSLEAGSAECLLGSVQVSPVFFEFISDHGLIKPLMGLAPSELYLLDALYSLEKSFPNGVSGALLFKVFANRIKRERGATVDQNVYHVTLNRLRGSLSSSCPALTILSFGGNSSKCYLLKLHSEETANVQEC